MVTLPDKKKLVHNFKRCANKEEKYLYIIELGTRLPTSPDLLQHPENLIPGCQSRVWITVNFSSKNGCVLLDGDSDSALIKGLITIIFSIYQGMNPQEIIDFDVCPILTELSLTQQLTVSRSQGLEAMIRTIRQKALILTQA